MEREYKRLHEKINECLDSETVNTIISKLNPEDHVEFTTMAEFSRKYKQFLEENFTSFYFLIFMCKNIQ